MRKKDSTQQVNAAPTSINTRKAVKDLHKLRDVLINHRMLEYSPQGLHVQGMTETLKEFNYAYLTSENLVNTDSDTRFTINDHFWMFYETCEYIERLPDAEELKSGLLETLNRLITLFEYMESTGEEVIHLDESLANVTIQMKGGLK